MTKSNKEKCTISADGKHVEPCDMLADQCEYGHPMRRKRGIFRWAYTITSTGKPSRTFFGIVSSKSPNGMIFNCCPFCGEKIDHPVLNEEEKAAEAAEIA